MTGLDGSLGLSSGCGASSSPTDRGPGGFLPCIESEHRTGLSPPWKIDHNSRQRWKHDRIVWNRQKALRTGQSEGQTFLGRESDQTRPKEHWHLRRRRLTHPADHSLGRRFVPCPSAHPPRARARRGCPYVPVTPTLDFFRQITMKKSSDNSEKKNVWDNLGLASVRFIILLPQI